jgi:hypothetical protein
MLTDGKREFRANQPNIMQISIIQPGRGNFCGGQRVTQQYDGREQAE